jgi:hypothetical protein
MKRTWSILALLLVFVMLFGACSGAGNNTDNAEGNDEGQQSESTPTPTTAAANTKVYFNNWMLDKFLSESPNKTYSKSLPDDYLGEVVEISATKLKTSAGEMQNPQFKEEKITAQQFESEFGVSADDIKGNGSQITKVTVTNYSIADSTNDKIGTTIIVVDTTCYLVIGGAIFQMSTMSF